MEQPCQGLSTAMQVAGTWPFSLSVEKYRLGVLMLSVLIPLSSYGASFDCAKAKTSAEKFVCGNNDISKLDDELASAYQDALSKADNTQQKELMSEQRHWLRYTRRGCTNEICFKHAYWSRLAEVKTFFEPKSPLYRKEADKAHAIQKVLATFPFFKSTFSESQACRQIMTDLKKMKGIRFVDPIVQVQSYEDPSLDSWKQRFKCEEPLNYSATCLPDFNGDWRNKKLLLNVCAAGYGLPPFKLYELPSMSGSYKKRYIFYSDSSYGPMNEDWKNPSVNGGYRGFHQIKFPHCDEFVNHASAPTYGSISDGPNYNSIIEYKKQYYFLILYKWDKSYWLNIRPIGKNKICSWAPVK